MDLLSLLVGATSGAFALFLWNLNRRQTLRMAVFDKRFQAHQELYTALAPLLGALQGDDIDSLMGYVATLQMLYLEKCLYLEAEPRSAIVQLSARLGEDLKLNIDGTANLNDLDRAAHQERVMTAIQAIDKAVGLPAISESEFAQYLKLKASK